MFLTGGTFGYAFLDILLSSFIEISFDLPFAVSDASDSDVYPPCSTLVFLADRAVAVRLPFQVLVEASDVPDA